MQALLRLSLPRPFKATAFSRGFSTPAKSLVDCSKVLTRRDIYDGVGTFARVANLTGVRTFAADTEREALWDYWNSDHNAPTLQAMMLDGDADVMDTLERPEILSELPSFAGKRVLELGAGIGRFSGTLADKANEVVAVDFVESSCAENRRANAAHKNLTVLTADATSLQQPSSSFDLVFSNWLLMYLTDEEVENFAHNALEWLQPGGHLFFRESCFHASGNAARRFNPTKYRDPQHYSQMFSDAVLADGSRFQLLATNCVESYAEMKGNVHQMWFRWKKVRPSSATKVLETGQNSTRSALRFEQIYGHDYIYTGGEEISRMIGERCAEHMKPGMRFLDIGCGLGGTMYHLAETNPEVYFHGITASAALAAMLSGRHVRRPTQIRKRVSFDLATEMGVPEDELRYPPNSFDVVCLRESLMYLRQADKAVILRKASRLLRPGGQVVVIDYCLGPKAANDLLGRPPPESVALFGQHLSEWGYRLQEPDKTVEILARYFKVDDTQDKTDDFVRHMDKGLGHIDASFGPSAPARAKPALSGDGLTALREKLAAEVTSALPEGIAEAAAAEAADAALAKVSLHMATLEAEAVRCVEDHAWATRIWSLERRAALEGHLRWVMFVATKEAGRGAPDGA